MYIVWKVPYHKEHATKVDNQLCKRRTGTAALTGLVNRGTGPLTLPFICDYGLSSHDLLFLFSYFTGARCLAGTERESIHNLGTTHTLGTGFALMLVHLAG